MEWTLNRLPVQTWNHLGMNESKALLEKPRFIQPQATLQDGGLSWERREDEPEGWKRIDTGMGHEIGEMLEEGPVGMLTSPEDSSGCALLEYAYGKEIPSAGRLYIHAEKGSRLSVICLLRTSEAKEKSDPSGAFGQSAESGSGAETEEKTAVLETKIFAEEGAEVKLYMVQLLDQGFRCFNDLGIHCRQGAGTELLKLELGAECLYTGVLADLAGKSSSFQAQLGYHVAGGQHMDMNYVVRHQGKKARSAMDACGSLEEGAVRLFRGTIDFVRGCAGAKGTEREEALLLGNKVTNQTIPLILCGEEDVEGDHGATIGRLDEKVLFYLGSRGIDQKTAGQMISRARIDALSERIPSPEVQEKITAFREEKEEWKREKKL